MKPAKLVQNVVPEYQIIGEPVTVTARAPYSHDELRVTKVTKQGEAEPKIDVRFWTVHSDGSESAHRGGLRLTPDEAAALRDALNEIV